MDLLGAGVADREGTGIEPDTVAQGCVIPRKGRGAVRTPSDDGPGRGPLRRSLASPDLSPVRRAALGAREGIELKIQNSRFIEMLYIIIKMILL